jgi:nucleotide sugar dehydrogenase
MRILIWGLGYVGTVSAACLAKLGHEVVGAEPNLDKVATLNAGHSPIKEPGLDTLVSEMVAEGRLRAVKDGAPLVNWADISMICVGTPSAADGSTSLEYVTSVAKDIADGLRNSSSYHLVVLRSTVFPGATRTILQPILEERSGRRAGRDFGIVVNPEFLRETSAINDFYAPPYTVIGQIDKNAGDLIESVYRDIDAKIYRVALEQAEILKLVNNSFHALKIGFANEIGRMCEALGLDSHSVMELVCADTKLNISPAYMRPGFAFGGSCLPKDLRSLTFSARRLGVSLPILDAVLPSNQLQVEAARIKVHELNPRCVGVLGLSFKAGTDDLRESPVIGLIRNLWQDGMDLLVHDPDVEPDKMLGSNREYLERQLPQINDILRTRISDVLKASQVVIVSQKRPEFMAALQNLNGRVAVIDLVRLSENGYMPGISKYRGISW